MLFTLLFQLWDGDDHKGIEQLDQVLFACRRRELGECIPDRVDVGDDGAVQDCEEAFIRESGLFGPGKLQVHKKPIEILLALFSPVDLELAGDLITVDEDILQEIIDYYLVRRFGITVAIKFHRIEIFGYLYHDNIF